MANTTERIGVHYCGVIAERNKWMFREQPIDDIGIDVYMEITEDTGEPKQLIALQIKSGSSWFKEQKDECVVFRNINERQYKYWTMNSLPCIIVLYNPEDNMCIWQKLTTETIQRTHDGEGKGFFVKVPINQIFLNEESNEQLLEFSNLPQHITNYNFLLSQKKFMEIIKNGGQIKLHSTEWIHKSSGKGETELIVNDGVNVEKYSYPYWFPFTSYTEVFPKLFPWANFTADEDFYRESDEFNWREYNLYYDSEDDEWIQVGESFEEFRKKLNPMRSVLHSGEVAEYMLILSLNELGNSFLNVESFVSHKHPYVKARAKGEENV